MKTSQENLRHKWVKIVCSVYAGRQKDQKTKLVKFPAGTKAQIRTVQHELIDKKIPDGKMTYYLLKIPVDVPGKKSKFFWVKVSPIMVTMEPEETNNTNG